ncbi:hypothetical protein HPP92_012839 [Vanilla planifolia]|uniref:Uncharacterized protein n=1 Tax=Vanilla planifolia TaxID=51239 RepID=A0A835UZF3_VANPL|nr:hypothetical protein HPP92_012839 [Vanilla planifolia]
MFFTGCCNLDIFSETGTKNVASFECEPSGDLVLSVMTKSKPTKTIGRVSISLEELMNPNAKLSIEKWFELKPCNEYANTKPIYLHVAASFTIPVPAPYALGMINPHPFSMDTCLFKLSAPTQSTKSWTHFVDYYGNDIISLQMRNLHQTEGSKHPTWKKSIFGLTRFSKKPHLLVEYAENSWSFKDYGFSLKVEKKDSLISIMLELKGFSQIIKLFPGARLEYELKNINKANVDDLMTVVEFSAENPYGKAIALLDFKTRLTKVREDWFVLPAIVLAFILSNLLKKGSRVTVASDSENTKGTKNCSKNSFVEEVMVATEDVETAGLATSTTRELVCPCEANSMIAGGCGNKVKSGGCGGGGCGSCGAEVSEATRLGAELAASEVVVVGA